MKKILILFLSIVVVAGAGIGFGATLDSNAIDPENIVNIGQNYGNSNDITQNEIDQSNNEDTYQTNTNEINENEGNNQNGNWYNGFWNDENNDHSGFWNDKDYNGFWNHDKDKCDDDHDKCCDDDKKDKCDDDKCCDDDDDDDDKGNIDIHNEIDNRVTVTANGGDSKSNSEVRLASDSKTNEISSEIKEYNYKSESNESQVPMKETGLPAVPALISALFIGSGLLYKKLRK